MMKKLNTLLLGASVVTLFLGAGNIFVLSYIKITLHNNSAAPEWLGGLVAVFLIVIALFHLLGLLGLFLQIRQFKTESILRAAAFALGFFSLFLLAVDVVMLQDIGNEYMLGHDISGEWSIVFTGHGVHFLFALIVALQCISVSKRLLEKPAIPSIVKDESVFLTVHQVGIFSAVLGFLCIIVLHVLGVPQAYIDGLLVFSSIVVLIPYGLTIAYWLFTKRKEKLADWYDEKQFMDLSRGALVTLVVSVLTMTGLFLLISSKIIAADMVIWYPIYLCSTLLVFSASTVVIAHNY